MQKPARFLLFLVLVLSSLTAALGQAERPVLLARRSFSEGGSLSKEPVLSLSKESLTVADSLFASRQYTQAFDQYVAIHKNGQWTPAMFLKMAYIQEALGHLGESLYYLNLYALASHDPQADVKMAELAEKHRLEGYEEQPSEALMVVLRSNYLPIAALLGALSLLMLALAFNRARKNRNPSWGLALLTVLLLSALVVHAQLTPESGRAIVTRGQTYLMSGPSGGASVVDIIGEGHLVRIKSRHDAWLKVEWKEGEAYVRDFLVRQVRL
jgi:hypothetical protein